MIKHQSAAEAQDDAARSTKRTGTNTPLAECWRHSSQKTKYRHEGDVAGEMLWQLRRT